jgi:hypothetical protein
MPLFQCSQCQCVENTACCNFWPRKLGKLPLLCSECDPEIAKWHGRFPKRTVEASGYILNHATGYLEPPGGWNNPQ